LRGAEVTENFVLAAAAGRAALRAFLYVPKTRGARFALATFPTHPTILNEFLGFRDTWETPGIPPKRTCLAALRLPGEDRSMDIFFVLKELAKWGFLKFFIMVI
jgi:hypothetical protein